MEISLVAHLIVPEDGDDAVPWGRNVGEIKPAELSRQVLHGKDHRMLLPLQPKCL